MAPCRVCWRATAVRPPRVSRRNRSSRWAAIWSTESTLARAAASSMARGMPSSRRHTATAASPDRVGQAEAGMDLAGPLGE